MNPSRKHVAFAAVLAIAAALTAPASAPAAIVQVNDAKQGFWTAEVSPTDLVNTGSPTLVSAVPTGFTSVGFGSLATHAYDGSAATRATSSTQWNIVFTLNTSVNTLGYDINEIDSFYGPWNNRSNQNFTVEYTTVSNPAFTTLGTFTYTTPAAIANAGTDDATRVTLTDSGGTLASGVKSIRVTYLTIGASNFGGISQFDVEGVATAAIPAPAALPAGLALLGLAAARRRR